MKVATARWRSYLNHGGPLPISDRMRPSLQKINSYSWLPDDLYGLQALNLTPHLLQKYFFRLSQPSVSVRKTDYLYRSEELRVCVSTSIREAMMGHAWNVMVSASPSEDQTNKIFRQTDSSFCQRGCKQVMTTVCDRRVTVVGELQFLAQRAP